MVVALHMETYTLPTDYQSFIHKSRYARWSDELGRRETWSETVDRYFTYLEGRFPQVKDLLQECRDYVGELKVMPSMRLMMTAGKAIEATGDVAGYNCAYIPIDHPHAFDEVCYILLCGTGVGYSVERQFVDKLPEIPQVFYPSPSRIVVPDSKIGWATSLRELISMLYAGKLPEIDYSRIRPKGSRLKTFGGRASGPEPLKELFEFCIELFQKAAGRRLHSIEAHDLVCKIADIVVVGGVRRSALISLSDLSDSEMRLAKSGRWWETNPHRRLANNSAVYQDKPSIDVFMEEWLSLKQSGSGERGICNRYAFKSHLEKLGYRQFHPAMGTNPCFEILLKPFQFCNLTSVQLHEDDTREDIRKKVRVATILGTVQSAMTDFKYIRKVWKRTCDEERLLGVSLSGICDVDFMCGTMGGLKHILEDLRQIARNVNAEVAGILGIEPSKAITCVKPEGTTSQLCNRASGIHTRWAPFYIRTVRADKKDPLTRMMIDMGFPCEDDVMSPNTTAVFSFPVEAPQLSKFRHESNAIEQLELWLIYKKHWAEHTVSVTIYVKEHEWLDVAAWVYRHFDDITGISFLPHSDHVYKQAPYQDCTMDEFEALKAKMPKDIDWNKLAQYEIDDNTTGMQELACVGNSCELK